MSFDEILRAIPQLTPEERKSLILLLIDSLIEPSHQPVPAHALPQANLPSEAEDAPDEAHITYDWDYWS